MSCFSTSAPSQERISNAAGKTSKRSQTEVWAEKLGQGVGLITLRRDCFYFVSFYICSTKKPTWGPSCTGEVGEIETQFDTPTYITHARWIPRPRTGGQCTEGKPPHFVKGEKRRVLRSVKIICGYRKQGWGATSTEVAGEGQDDANAHRC